jgi:hypothetical protein
MAAHVVEVKIRFKNKGISSDWSSLNAACELSGRNQVCLGWIDSPLATFFIKAAAWIAKVVQRPGIDVKRLESIATQCFNAASEIEALRI